MVFWNPGYQLVMYS